jgi:probable rRNA maturation factor
MNDDYRGRDQASCVPVESLNVDLIPTGAIGWMRGHLERLRVLAAPELVRLTIRLVDDAEMRRLHARHMNDPTTTDVLTFADGNEVDVAVCVDEARRRAAELGHDLSRELLLYSLHGLLHAVGFDDREPADFERMHAEEDRLLAAIGIAATFAPRGGTA